MVNTNLVILIPLYFLVFFFIVRFSIDMTSTYPEFVINIFDEPISRFIGYILIFMVSYISPMLSLLLLIIVISLHLDYINVIKNKWMMTTTKDGSNE